MSILNTSLLFSITAIMEITGCFLPALWLEKKAGAWVLIPAFLALTAFVWLLSLHPAASGRIYAAYGGVYVAVAILWLYIIDGIKPNIYDIAGSIVAILGMLIIVVGSFYNEK